MGKLESVRWSVVRSLINELGLSRTDAEDAAQEAVLGILECAFRSGRPTPGSDEICARWLSAARADAVDEMRSWSNRRSAEAVE